MVAESNSFSSLSLSIMINFIRHMKKILYIGGFEMPDKNAAAQRAMANALLLREMGFEVSFIGPTKDRSNAVSEANGFKFEYVDYPTSTKQWLYYITEFVSTAKILEYQPDYVVMYNFPAVASLNILKTCHKHGIKVVHDLTEWESENGWRPVSIIKRLNIWLRMHYCMKKMDGVIAISRYLYNNYKKYTNTILVPPTVDLTNPKFNRNRELITSDKVSLVFAGNAGFGVKDRLDLIIDEVRKFNNLHLAVIGMTKEQYEAGYGALDSSVSNVEFRGRVPHAEAVKAVCEADFQMLIRENTLKNTAGFPTKFVESMSCCTPLIATLTSNIGDYLQDGVNGFIVSDEHPLGEVLEKAASLSSAEKIKMKEACKSFEGFDYHSYKDEFSKIFK